MEASISLSDPGRNVNLLHAFLATHNKFSHDHDRISFRAHGKSLTIDMAIGHVTFGSADASEEDRLWSDNMSAGDMELLLIHFIFQRWSALEEYNWDSKLEA